MGANGDHRDAGHQGRKRTLQDGQILRPHIPQYGHVASVEKPNVIILSDHAENIARMEKIIQEIDVANDEQVVVVPLKEAYVDTMVALLAELAPDALGETGNNPQAVQVVANARNNSLVLRGAEPQRSSA